jgi:hypothetical protein
VSMDIGDCCYFYFLHREVATFHIYTSSMTILH